MKLVLVLAVLALALQAEPPEYPAGTFCTPRGDMVGHLQTADHPCHCARMHVSEDTGEPVHGAACETAPATHDPQCQQWCHEDHCGCEVSCAEAGR